MTADRNSTTTVVRKRVDGDIREAIEQAIDAIGGAHRYVTRGGMVTIKPNLNTADPYPASSDPEFIRALGQVLLDGGAAKLRIVESSMFGVKTRKVARKTGILDVARDLGAEIVFLDEDQWVPVTIPNGQYMKQAHVGKALLESKNLVLAPCLKTHRYARFTATMKLFVGAIRTRDRLKMHARRLEVKIPEVASLFRPSLVVMDARRVFVTGGPFHGQVESPDLIIVGTDMLAVDVVAVRLLQSYKAENRLDMPVWNLPQIRHGAEIGLGVSRDDQIQVIDID